jgi:hypothetical protein
MTLLINRIKGLDNEAQIIESEFVMLVNLMETIRLKIVELKKEGVEKNKEKLIELISEYRSTFFRVHTYETCFYHNLTLIKELKFLAESQGEQVLLSEKVQEVLGKIGEKLTQPIIIDTAKKSILLKNEEEYKLMEEQFRKGMSDEHLIQQLNDPRFSVNVD